MGFLAYVDLVGKMRMNEWIWGCIHWVVELSGPRSATMSALMKKPQPQSCVKLPSSHRTITTSWGFEV